MDVEHRWGAVSQGVADTRRAGRLRTRKRPAHPVAEPRLAGTRRHAAAAARVPRRGASAARGLGRWRVDGPGLRPQLRDHGRQPAGLQHACPRHSRLRGALSGSASASRTADERPAEHRDPRPERRHPARFRRLGAIGDHGPELRLIQHARDHHADGPVHGGRNHRRGPCARTSSPTA